MSVSPVSVDPVSDGIRFAAKPLRALVAKSDRLYADCLVQALGEAFPSIEVQHAIDLNSARACLLDTDAETDILLTGVGFSDGDALEWLAELAKIHRVGRIVVVTARREVRLHLLFRDLKIDGLFNAFEEGLPILVSALQQVWEGTIYRSESFKSLLRCSDDDRMALFHQLSTKEQLVLSVIGDGSDNQEAAEYLRMTVAAVRTHRKRLHAKLGISHKGELMRLAIKHGFVRVTGNEIVRPGFSQLLERVSRGLFE